MQLNHVVEARRTALKMSTPFNGCQHWCHSMAGARPKIQSVCFGVRRHPSNERLVSTLSRLRLGMKAIQSGCAECMTGMVSSIKMACVRGKFWADRMGASIVASWIQGHGVIKGRGCDSVGIGYGGSWLESTERPELDR